jgi:hypothetical protein
MKKLIKREDKHFEQLKYAEGLEKKLNFLKQQLDFISKHFQTTLGKSGNILQAFRKNNDKLFEYKNYQNIRKSNFEGGGNHGDPANLLNNEKILGAPKNMENKEVGGPNIFDDISFSSKNNINNCNENK